jgi:hypothetical protein
MVVARTADNGRKRQHVFSGVEPRMLWIFWERQSERECEQADRDCDDTLTGNFVARGHFLNPMWGHEMILSPGRDKTDKSEIQQEDDCAMPT